MYACLYTTRDEQATSTRDIPKSREPQYMCTGGISRPYLGGRGLGVDKGGRGGEKTGRRGGRMRAGGIGCCQ